MNDDINSRTMFAGIIRDLGRHNQLIRAVRHAYNFIQSHQPQTERKNTMLTPDPIGEVNAILAAYQTLLTAYTGALAQIATLTTTIASEVDTASPDLQSAIDAANAFVVANPPPTPPAPAASAATASPATPAASS